MDGPGFTVAAVILTDGAGRFLTVRKTGTASFMLPGGKIEAGESSDATARREVSEELGLTLQPDRLVFVDRYFTAAANEPGHWLRSDVYRYLDPIAGERPASEIAEARWIDPDDPGPLAPLTEALLPRLRRPA